MIAAARHAPVARRKRDPVALCFSLVFLVGAAFALDLVRKEWVTYDISLGLTDPAHGTRDAVLEQYGDTKPNALPLRARAALAEQAIDAARTESDRGFRELNLARADGLVHDLEQSYPDWVATNLLTARLEFARNGGATPRAMRGFAASYRAAGFLWRDGMWRIAFGSLYWASLDHTTRDAVIDEAVWLSRFDGGQRGAIERIFGDSPAGVAYQLRMDSGSDPAGRS